MKFILPLFFFYSLNIFACPKLSGKYSRCFDARTLNPINVNLEISQKVVNKITIFTVKSTDPHSQETSTEEYRADGKTIIQSERDPETGSTISLETTIGCDGDILKSLIELKQDGQIFSRLLTSLTKINLQLIQTSVGTDENGEEQETQVICE